jgi:hypothetical protein
MCVSEDEELAVKTFCGPILPVLERYAELYQALDDLVHIVILCRAHEAAPGKLLQIA